MSINGAMGVLVHFTMHPDFPMISISEAMGVVEESADENADVIFGTTTDATLPVDYIKITLIATGFEHEDAAKKAPAANNNAYETPAASEAPAVSRTVTRPRMVVGGDLSEDFLDVPTYMRQQKD